MALTPISLSSGRIGSHTYKFCSWMKREKLIIKNVWIASLSSPVAMKGDGVWTLLDRHEGTQGHT